jgi:hypothetical protein
LKPRAVCRSLRESGSNDGRRDRAVPATWKTRIPCTPPPGGVDAERRLHAGGRGSVAASRWAAQGLAQIHRSAADVTANEVCVHALAIALACARTQNIQSVRSKTETQCGAQDSGAAQPAQLERCQRICAVTPENSGCRSASSSWTFTVSHDATGVESTRVDPAEKLVGAGRAPDPPVTVPASPPPNDSLCTRKSHLAAITSGFCTSAKPAANKAANSSDRKTQPSSAAQHEDITAGTFTHSSNR